MRSVVLGTAGHIDHGKTALIQALTGVDTDRLKEERERGITIDLGFAHLDVEGEVRLGIIDVPGHEGFVRNMVAGATGMDLAILVVAADEGPMPQTEEHLAILGFLGVESIVVALTKSDLADAEWLELVRDDTRTFLEGTRFEGAELIPTSAKTGEGMDALKSALAHLAQRQISRPEQDRLRLPIDRAFTIRGTGTVVTGTLWSGSVMTGKRLRIGPGDLEGRVRGVQVHGQAVERAVAGERAAVALVGVAKNQIRRGQCLVDLEPWTPSDRLTVRLQTLQGRRALLDRGKRVRLHLGTEEVMARVYPLGQQVIPAGEQGWAELRLERPIIARARDRLVIRSYSPVTTIAGGVVLEPFPPRRKRRQAPPREDLIALESGPVERALQAALQNAAFDGASEALLPILTGFTPAQVDVGLADLDARRAADGRWFVGTRVTEVATVVLDRLRENVERDPLSPGLALAGLDDMLGDGVPQNAVHLAIHDLQQGGRVHIRAGLIQLADHVPTATPRQQALLSRISEAYRAAGLEPPTVTALAEEIGQGQVWGLLAHLEREGTLSRVDDELFMWTEALEHAISSVRAQLGGQKGLGPADFRAALPVSRRFLMPLLGIMDRIGVTHRGQDGREVLSAQEPRSREDV